MAVGLLVLVIGDDIGVQGRSDGQRELLDAESVAGHLLGRGRPSVSADVMAAVITLQTLQGAGMALPDPSDPTASHIRVVA